MAKKSEIKFEVSLDENNVPEKIFWYAQDGQKESEAKAFLLSVLDKDTKDTLKLDLWTKDLQIDEMDKLMFNTFNSLADTYFNSTNNEALASQIKNFAQFFGEETEILQRKA